MPTTKLSEHFTLEEATYSESALRHNINNVPCIEIVYNMRVAAIKLEEVRRLLAFPIHVNSWYRCPTLNDVVGGSPASAHMDGWAIDFTCPGLGSVENVTKLIFMSNIKYDQLIYEYTWCHISFHPDMRQQVLTLRRAGGYMNGIISAKV